MLPSNHVADFIASYNAVLSPLLRENVLLHFTVSEKFKIPL